MHYPINEIFQTIQGEGVFTGLPAIFVRLQGCPVGCPWCDTRHTWVVDPAREVGVQAVLDCSNESDGWSKMSTEQILASFQQLGYQARHVVITGGEPCLYDLQGLSAALIEAGYQVQIETSGTSEIQTHEQTWVTVSPKINMKGGLPVLVSALDRANEIKHPVATERHVEELDALLATASLRENVVIALQPISQKPRATQLAMATCIARNWRLSIQTHKYLDID
ncbi:TPA: 7-carboxy-7-deazaguanine synthase QueE [Aeromonas hydrophila]|uniref:7-carboxy-7-deazaguanine synthase QueE n=1 Tax=Aeromonas TaxID=642 RepID=UPI00090B707A|nr:MULTISPECIES: 7-carboxy-7-deazaguanine synthase QueE [Aeromonas]HEB4992976.1 7-carboxy-7-deazaguanine synthase QueE [Aeromonas hydrophila subsp. hydrophila]APJ17475.1 7-carboxy-7-deazaguanine synthase QueE [Aeromonas hydrophila]BBT07036.1 7-carboxy-7-deazaguanine synthase [Aeromonas hydrophila]HEB5044727.1 7-carboxy-7-deazaguanine synthase QueE [Aeromonas hydrophila subsp. hydrophila]HEB5077531.1 7-carboxy-7-deazaguanine synthase QueE [Aeromonas hydrophila subsp. hydrophila]